MIIYHVEVTISLKQAPCTCLSSHSSISIEEAAREEEEKQKKVDKLPTMAQVQETQETSTAKDDAKQSTKDTSADDETLKGATAAAEQPVAAICTTSDKDAPAGACSSCEPGDKVQLEKDLDSQTLAQLSDIEDKMNQLCTAANSLLNRKRFLVMGKEEGEEEGGKKDDECKEVDAAKTGKSGDELGVGKSNTDGGSVAETEVKPEANTMISDSKDDAQTDAQSSANVCDNISIPPVEEAPSVVDNAKSDVKANESSCAIKPKSSESIDRIAGAEDEHKTGSKFVMLFRVAIY